jgi:hypothetical protein
MRSLPLGVDGVAGKRTPTRRSALQSAIQRILKEDQIQIKD